MSAGCRHEGNRSAPSRCLSNRIVGRRPGRALVEGRTGNDTINITGALSGGTATIDGGDLLRKRERRDGYQNGVGDPNSYFVASDGVEVTRNGKRVELASASQDARLMQAAGEDECPCRLPALV